MACTIWNTCPRIGEGYELTALIPAAMLGIDPAGEFRCQAMLGVQAPGRTEARILPLVGRTTSYNDSKRFCLCRQPGTTGQPARTA